MENEDRQKNIHGMTFNGLGPGSKLRRRDIAKLVICKICEQSMTKPKCLSCMHSFCAKCLSGYLIKLAEGAKNTPHNFKCPSCQADNRIPETSEPVQDWVRFISSSALMTFLLEKMALENTKKCDPCGRGDKETEGRHWCKDCGETLCESCANYHTKVKALMDHKIVTLEEMRKQPASTPDTEELCSKHSGKYIEAFCEDHDIICCVQCITEDHRQCNTIKTIDNMAQGIKTKLEPLLFRLEEIEKQAVSVVENRKTNMDDLEKQKDDILTEVNKAREDIQRHFEAIESKLKKEVYQTHETLSEELQLQARNFDYIYQNCNNGKKILSASLSYGSDRDTFLSAYKLRKQCENHETYIRTQSENILHHDYSLHMNEIIKEFTDKVREMGTVSTEEKPTNILPSFLRDMWASKLVDMSGKSFSDTSRSWFTGGIFIDNGLLVLSDYRNRKLKCFKADLMTNELVLDDNPWDICFLEHGLDGDLILVTFPNDTVIKTVKIDSGGKMVLVDKEYEIGSGGHGLHIHDSNVYIACSNEIRMLSMKTGEVSTMDIGNRGARYVILTRKSGISYTTKASVTSHDRKGRETFRYKSEDLRSPRGISEDSEGNIYVCAIDSNNIHQLSPNGELVKILLSSKDGINNPYHLRFEKTTTRFFVTEMDSDVVKLYELVTNWQ